MKTLNIRYFQHVQFEGLGCIEKWARLNGHKLTSTKFYEDAYLPDINNIDWLIIMGGPMSAYEENKFAWLKEEKKFIKQAVENGKTVIGICLGSQLLAAALGAKVYPNKEKEIGWFNVELTSDGKEDKLFKGFENKFKVFHWHGDTFDLPQGAVHLAQTDNCKNQAFLYKDKVLGLQFHFETTEQTLAAMVANCNNELTNGSLIQSEAEILNSRNYIEANNLKMFEILNRLSQI